MTAYNDLSPRALWFLNNFSELDLAQICADKEARLNANTATLNAIRALAATGYDRRSHPEQMGYLNAMGRIATALANTAPAMEAPHA